MSERAASDAVSVAYSEKKQPLARGFLDPSDIADAAVFLLSDEASRITGQVIDVDGGWGLTEAGP
jgi:NAD(P)-dependent dehydrogenase (short-subunit alcohol dehydrogenase family)